MNPIFPMKSFALAGGLTAIACTNAALADAKVWTVESAGDWGKVKSAAEQIEIEGDLSKSVTPESRFSSTIKAFGEKRKALRITFKQSDLWDNWIEVPNVGVPEMDNALVFLPVKDGDYWMFGRHADAKKENRTKGKKHKDLTPEEVRERQLAGMTGYHAWHSTDMKSWTHCGPITDKEGGWMTTAEYADGKFYFYYDKPNDQDPHLVIDDDPSDGVPGKSYGMALNDPTNGSDAGVIRDEDGSFHMIFEDWSYNDARAHAWDAPVAGHAVSSDGEPPFKILDKFIVDERTKPTGETGTFMHSSSTEPLSYQIHSPEQNAYGDWTAIKVGGQYYLFCDYDPVGRGIKVGRFTSDSLDKKFEFVGEFGEGHPDPSVGFAEGQFYLIQQRGNVDFISPGPWVSGVEARAGVDVSGDGKVDQWTDWQEISESYAQKKGFARIVETTPASIDLGGLPEGHGFAFEYRTSKVDGVAVQVSMDRVEMTFE